MNGLEYNLQQMVVIMKKIIVYGLGKEFEKIRVYLNKRYDIVAYCDKNKKYEWSIYISDIAKYEFDYIYVTTERFYEQITTELVSDYRIVKEKIVTKKHILGDYENYIKRDKWVISKIETFNKGVSILDAGAGEQRYRQYCNELNYISQDFSQYKPGGKKGLQFDKWDYTGIDIVSDITRIPLEDETMDAILCTEVFEHISQPIEAIKEFSRLLKKDGILLLTAPFCSLTHMAPYFFYNGFSEYWYKKILGEFGLEILSIEKYGNYFSYLQQELERLPMMVEEYTNISLKEDEILEIYNMIGKLGEASKANIGSEDVLCFGLLVEAKKK